MATTQKIRINVNEMAEFLNERRVDAPSHQVSVPVQRHWCDGGVRGFGRTDQINDALT